MHFRNVAIESVAYEHAPVRVSSDDLERQLNGAMTRLRLPPKPIELLTGITERGYWPPGTTVSEVAARAGRRALAVAGVDPLEVGLLLNTSVCKDFLEPSMAALVHGSLGLGPKCRNFDISNACLGFMNGIEVAGQLIDAGVIDTALVVDGESSRDIVKATIRRLHAPDSTSQDFWDNFATLTLGSTAVAMVLTRADRARGSHRVLGSVSLADTENNRLCIGNAERMITDSTRLLKAGVQLARRTWTLASEQLTDWSDAGIDQYVCHQVGRSHLAALAQTLEINPQKIFATYPRHGNVGPAAVPLTLALAVEAGAVKAGQHVALMGIGSGLNVAMMSVRW